MGIQKNAEKHLFGVKQLIIGKQMQNKAIQLQSRSYR